MTEPLLLSIDNGTQSLRAIVFDSQGRIVAKSQQWFEPYVSPRPGWAEQDPLVYWDALCRACREVVAHPDVRADQLQGLAVTTQRGTVINLDREGNPLRPAILWLDKRTISGEPPVGGLWGLLFKIAGVSHTVAHLQANAESNWIRRMQPDIWEKTHKFVLLSGYLNYKLTGNWVDSIGSQVGYLPFDYKALKWAKPSDWKWNVLGIEAEQLTDLVPPGSLLGKVGAEAARQTGLPLNLPVYAAAADKACEVLGAGSLAREIGCLSYGTTATINITSTKYLEAHAFIPPYPAAVPGNYSPEVQIFRGYWMVEWFKREFGQDVIRKAEQQGIKPEQLLEEKIRDIKPGCDGLLLQPFWTPGVKIPGPEARGSVVGFTDNHGRGHLYRAILEGLAFALREGAEHIQRRGKLKLNTIRVSGGGSQSDTAMQITADVFGLPAARPHTYETSGLGAAMVLAVGLGIYGNFEQAAANMTRVGKVFQPIPANRDHYDKLYRRIYLKIYKRLAPLYRDLHQLESP